MAETDVRISELTDTTTSAANDDYIALDGATYGTRKMLASNLVGPEASARAEGDEALDEKIGTLSNLTTTAKGSAVAAINEVDSHADTAQNTADNNAAAIGTLSSLTTDAKGSLVAAINEVDSHADGKVDKVNGKGLSTNDYTDAEKTKLSGIEAGAEVNDVTSVAGKTGAVTLAGGDVSYSDETTYADGTVGAAISGLKSDLAELSPGLSDAAKTALLDCFAHVMWIGTDGQTYMDALEAALYEEGRTITYVVKDLVPSTLSERVVYTIEGIDLDCGDYVEYSLSKVVTGGNGASVIRLGDNPDGTGIFTYSASAGHKYIVYTNPSIGIIEIYFCPADKMIANDDGGPESWVNVREQFTAQTTPSSSDDLVVRVDKDGLTLNGVRFTSSKSGYSRMIDWMRSRSILFSGVPNSSGGITIDYIKVYRTAKIGKWGWLYHFDDTLESSGTKDFGLTGVENYAAGVSGKAYWHKITQDGSSSIDVGAIAKTGLEHNVPLAGDFTIALWYKTVDANGYLFAISEHVGDAGISSSNKYFSSVTAASGTGWGVTYNATASKKWAGISACIENGNLNFGIHNADVDHSSYLALTPPSGFDPKVWHHYAVTKQDNNYYFFVDGVLICTGVSSYLLHLTNQIAIGGRFGNSAATKTNVMDLPYDYACYVDDFYLNTSCKWTSGFDPDEIIY